MEKTKLVCIYAIARSRGIVIGEEVANRSGSRYTGTIVIPVLGFTYKPYQPREPVQSDTRTDMAAKVFKMTAF